MDANLLRVWETPSELSQLAKLSAGTYAGLGNCPVVVKAGFIAGISGCFSPTYYEFRSASIPATGQWAHQLEAP